MQKIDSSRSLLPPNPPLFSPASDFRFRRYGFALKVHELVLRREFAIIPIGDLYTMSPHEAAAACKLLRPAKVIPMHFGTFPALTGTPEKLREKLASAQTEVWPLDPGKTVKW